MACLQMCNNPLSLFIPKTNSIFGEYLKLYEKIQLIISSSGIRAEVGITIADHIIPTDGLRLSSTWN